MVRISGYLKSTGITRKIVLIVSVVLIFDILAAGLSPLLRERISFFSGKSQMHVLSDLLFFEGTIIFAVGAFIASGMPWPLRGSRHPRDRHYNEESTGADVRESRKKRMSPGILMMMIGASLIGLSIAIGALLP